MRASHKRILLVTLLGTMVGVPALAQQGGGLTPYPACTVKPSAQDSEAAHSAFLLGKRFFDEADYGTAIHNFVDAYKLDCTKTELLTIIARAKELSGNRAEAVHALETYLQRAQNVAPEDKAQIQKRIENLKAQVAAQSSASVSATASATAPPSGTTSAAPSATPSSTAAPPAREHTAYPWIVVAAGGVAMLVGGILFGVEKNAANKAAARCLGSNVANCQLAAPSGDKAKDAAALNSINSDYNSANNLVPVGSVTFFAGAGVVAVGLLWHFLEPTGPAPTSGTGPKADTKTGASLAPVLAPGYAGLSYGGSF
jgi:hypothetical protein